MKILGPNDLGTGILIEYDAGYVSPTERYNTPLIREGKDLLDYSKPFELYAVLQKSDTPNRNGRVYPDKLLKREIDNYKKAIAKNTALSELNHPESSLVDLDRVSHMITDIWWEGPNVVMGKLRLLTTPGFHERGIVSSKADLAANYLRHGVTLGISSRGVGSLVKKGEQNHVQDDFELICFDLVWSPSTPGAYLFHNKDDRMKYEENLEEENSMRQTRFSASQSSSGNKSLDLMKKLEDYLSK